MTKLISTQDLEAFKQLTNARTVREAFNNSSKVVVELPISESVTLRLNLTAINVTYEGIFYGRNDGYTHLRVPSLSRSYIDGDYNLLGKGARSVETYEKVREVLELL